MLGTEQEAKISEGRAEREATQLNGAEPRPPWQKRTRPGGLVNAAVGPTKGAVAQTKMGLRFLLANDDSCQKPQLVIGQYSAHPSQA